MSSKIDPEIKPRDSDYTVLQREGISPAFVDWELINFVEYFIERGENDDPIAKKSAWHTALRKWMRRSFQGRRGSEFEQNRERIMMHRPKSRKAQGDIFENLLGGMIAKDLPRPEKKGRVYRAYKQPEYTEKMTAADGLAALAQFRKRS